VFRATVDRIETTTNSSFDELTNNQGFLDLSGLLNTATSGARMEFGADNISIFDAVNTFPRVKIGAL
jgi:hypothetical protein